MTARYNTGIRFNHLGILEILSFVGEGVGAALYILAIATGQMTLAALGIAFVIAAVLSLGAHLGRPIRSWRAFTRLVSSWVSRGSLMMVGFLGFAILAVGAGYLEILAPWQKALKAVALIFSVGVLFYAGMVLRSMRAVRLWRGPLVPLAFAAHSLATATAITWALAPWLGVEAAAVNWLPSFGIGCLILGFALSGLHIALAERSVGVKASLNRLLAGDLRQGFFWAAGGIGIVVPLLGLMSANALPGGGVGTLLFALVAICRLYGDYAYRNSIVVAGAYEPIFPARF